MPYSVYEPDFCSFSYNGLWFLLPSWKMSEIEKEDPRYFFLHNLYEHAAN